jgi:hypothetical protein
MNHVQEAAGALEASLGELLGVLGEGGASAEVVGHLQMRCHELTTSLVQVTAECESAELEEAKPVLLKAQRLNAIARGVVEHQRDAAGALVAGAQRIKRTLGSDAPIADGSSCDVRA